MHLVEFKVLARRELCKRIRCEDGDEINYFKKQACGNGHISPSLLLTSLFLFFQ